MQIMASAPLTRKTRRRPVARAGLQQLVRRQAEPLNRGVDPRPLLDQKLLAFAREEQAARAGFDEHPDPSLFLDELLVDQLLIALQAGERIDPIFGRDVA